MAPEAAPRSIAVAAVPVRLGVHQFGALTAAEAVVARVGADGVGAG